MMGRLFTALAVGICVYGVSLYFRGGLSGRPVYDILHAIGLIGVVAGTNLWLNRDKAA